MNEKVKKEWVDALRSGEYTQQTGHLHSGNKFCCLGVLCDLYGKKNGVKWYKGEVVDEFLGAAHYLPIEVQEWAGITGDNPQNPRVRDVSLSDYNDGGSVFLYIADLIEKDL